MIGKILASIIGVIFMVWVCFMIAKTDFLYLIICAPIFLAFFAIGIYIIKEK